MKSTMKETTTTKIPSHAETARKRGDEEGHTQATESLGRERSRGDRRRSRWDLENQISEESELSETDSVRSTSDEEDEARRLRRDRRD